MREDINCKQLGLNCKEVKSGAYVFRTNDEVIYVGSSKNLYNRMSQHKISIKSGSNKGSQKLLYSYLANNKFEVEIIFNDNYRKLEQKLIDELKPKFNHYKAFLNNEEHRIIKNERDKEYYHKNKEYFRNYYKEHKEHYKQLAKEKCKATI